MQIFFNPRRTATVYHYTSIGRVARCSSSVNVVYIDFGFRILRIDSESQKEEDEDKKFYIHTYLETLFTSILR